MRSPLCRRAFIAVVLLTHVVLLVVSSRLQFATIDESGHLPAGVSHWERGAFALYRVNPPLPRMVATLPVWLAGANANVGTLEDRPGRRLEWPASQRFAESNKDRYVEMIRLARLAGIVWSLLGAWLVMRWSTELFGANAGLLALALWCFGPNVLAHAQLLTPDLPCTVSGLAAFSVFRNYLRHPSWSSAWFSGLLLGIALLTKITWIILFGLWPLLMFAYLGERPISKCRLWLRARQAVLMAVVGLLVLNLGYGFQGTGRHLGDFVFVSKAFAGKSALVKEPGNRFKGSVLENLPVPLPADYVLGMDLQRVDFEANWPFYLNGDWSEGGHWYFYLEALLLKVPLGCLGLFLVALALMITRRSLAGWRDELLIWLPALAILVLVSSQSGLNYFRYVLPMLPFVLIGISRCATLLNRISPKSGALVLFLTLAAVASSLRAYPHSLSYFNEAAGGPENGHHYLVDSNLDWGQDLLYLKKWLDEHPENGPLGLAFFNYVDPRIIGIDYELPAFGPSGNQTPASAHPKPIGPYPGRYAISIHYVQGGSFLVPDGTNRRRTVPLHGYEYFQHFRPIAKAGYSIWIYELSLAEVNEVRERMGLPVLIE